MYALQPPYVASNLPLPPAHAGTFPFMSPGSTTVIQEQGRDHRGQNHIGYWSYTPFFKIEIKKQNKLKKWNFKKKNNDNNKENEFSKKIEHIENIPQLLFFYELKMK